MPTENRATSSPKIALVAGGGGVMENRALRVLVVEDDPRADKLEEAASGCGQRVRYPGRSAPLAGSGHRPALREARGSPRIAEAAETI
jgi:hypothetical protein